MQLSSLKILFVIGLGFFLFLLLFLLRSSSRHSEEFFLFSFGQGLEERVDRLEVFLGWCLALPFVLLLVLDVVVMFACAMSWFFANEAGSFLHKVSPLSSGHGIYVHGVWVAFFFLLSPVVAMGRLGGVGLGRF